MSAPERERASMATVPNSVAIVRGIYHCRRGEWHSGLHYLVKVGGTQPTGDDAFPGLYYSYLGHALARCERRHAEALALCEHAVRLGFFEPENFMNLAWVRLLAGDRRGALDAIDAGLALDAQHAALRELSERFGRRRPPVLSFLPREHALNRKLGRWRHAWMTRRAEA